MRYFLYLSYDGTPFCGWQIQPNGVSVQAKIEEALFTLLRCETPIVGAGRTDAGVHARQMVAHFDRVDQISDKIDFVNRLNSLLPREIAIHSVRSVQDEAHSRFDATYRTYNYEITLRKDPFLDKYAMRMHHCLDITAMNEAAKKLFLYSDFTSFSKLHTDVKTNNCQIINAEWIKTEHGLRFVIQADRFLRNMVRAIVGTLIEVGRGKITVADFCHIIEEKNRCSAGTSVPAKGLYLVDVGYPESIFID